MQSLAALFVRELRLAVRIGGGALMGVLFYLIVVTTFPFAIGPDLNLLSRLGPAILWIGALLSTLRYAYRGAEMIFDPVGDAFRFAGYRRTVNLAAANGSKEVVGGDAGVVPGNSSKVTTDLA